MNFLEFQPDKVHGVVIICPSEHQARLLMTYLQLNTCVKWSGGSDLSFDDTRWQHNKTNTGYVIALYGNSMSYGNIQTRAVQEFYNKPYYHTIHVDMLIEQLDFRF